MTVNALEDARSKVVEAESRLSKFRNLLAACLAERRTLAQRRESLVSASLDDDQAWGRLGEVDQAEASRQFEERNLECAVKLCQADLAQARQRFEGAAAAVKRSEGLRLIDRLITTMADFGAAVDSAAGRYDEALALAQQLCAEHPELVRTSSPSALLPDWVAAGILGSRSAALASALDLSLSRQSSFETWLAGLRGRISREPDTAVA